MDAAVDDDGHAVGWLHAELAGDEVTVLAEVVPGVDPVTALDKGVASSDADEPSLAVEVASLVPPLPVLAESLAFGVAGPVLPSVPTAAELSGWGESVACAANAGTCATST